MADDYQGVDIGDEEDEDKKQYPPAMPSAATAPLPSSVGTMTAPEGGNTGNVPLPMPNAGGAPPAMAPPPQEQSQYPMPSIGGAPGPPPNRQQAIQNTIGAAPNPADKQYQPAHPSWRQRLGAGLVALDSPQIGAQMMQEAEQRPVAQYQREAGAYGSKLAALEKGEEEQSKEQLEAAQAKAYGERGLTAEDVARINAQSRQGVAETNVGGRKDVANINQTGAGERNTATIAGAEQRNKETNETRKEVAGEKAGDAGTWSIQEDANGNPIEFNSKTGATRPATNIQKSGTKSKADAANEKLTEPVDTAIGYAEDYLGNGAFTGAGDEALQEKFFELAKPTTGFRMTQPQMDMLRNSRGWMGGAEAHLRHMATGTWFSNEQRQQIVNTMKELGEAKKKAITGGGEGGGKGKLTLDEARDYLSKAGGDKEKARQMAKQDKKGILMADVFDQLDEKKEDIFDQVAKPDALTQQTQATAKAAGASTAPAPMPSGYEPVTAHNDETQHPNNPIYQQLARNDQLQKRAHTLESMPSSYDAPLSNATTALGIAELPGAIPKGVRSVGNWMAGKMRDPATSAQSLQGAAGTPKNILPRSMQRWTIPDWVTEAVTPAGERGTPTNPGPFENLSKKAPVMNDLDIVNRDISARATEPRTSSTTSYLRKPAWANVPENAPPPIREPVQMPSETSWEVRAKANEGKPRPSSQIAPTAPQTPANGTYTSRLGRTWNAGDLASMPREQLAGEYAKEIAKPVAQQDQEWMTALKAESGRNTKGMYPGAAASTRGGARLKPGENVAPEPPIARGPVMAQTPSTSRATPTGEATLFEGANGKLPPELHADLEKQAGRKLTDEEAIALDRANHERAMAGGNKGEDIGAIREEHRAKLEQKGRR